MLDLSTRRSEARRVTLGESGRVAVFAAVAGASC